MNRPSTSESVDPGDEQFAHLMARATSGDIQAQDDICHQYERQVRIVARVLLGTALRPHLDSMDLMQSVHKSLLMGCAINALIYPALKNWWRWLVRLCAAR